MPKRMIPADGAYSTASAELFFSKNLGLLTHWSDTLSLRTIEEMEISGMQLGNVYFMLGRMHIVDDLGRDSSLYLGKLTAAAQELMREHLCQHFLCHVGSVGGDLLLLFCFPHATEGAPEFREAESACESFTERFRAQYPLGKFLLLLSLPCAGYAEIRGQYARLLQRLRYQLFMGRFPAFSPQRPEAPGGRANPEYADNDKMSRLAGRMVSAISRRSRRELGALEEETLGALFSGTAEGLEPVHFRLHVYLCALLKHLEARGITDGTFTRRQDVFRGLSTADSYHDFCLKFQEMIRGLLVHYDMVSARKPTTGAARLQQIWDYCGTHFRSPELTVSSLAALFGISQPQLSASFKRQFGISLLQHLNALRIQAVKELLRETDKPQAEIAVQCGFTNVTTMQRLFQRIEQCTPGQYRAGG